MYLSSLLRRSARPWSLHYGQNRHHLFSVLAHSQNKPRASGNGEVRREREGNWEFLLFPRLLWQSSLPAALCLSGNSICKWRRLTRMCEMDLRAAWLSVLC